MTHMLIPFARTLWKTEFLQNVAQATLLSSWGFSLVCHFETVGLQWLYKWPLPFPFHYRKKHGEKCRNFETFLKDVV